MAKVIMVQGTMSNAGKTFLCAALCRIFKQDGYRTAPFKSQNMALNSFVTKEGLEMGRAQVMQAEAAGVEPSVLMNPILLKPTTDMGSQVIVNGEVLGNMQAADYFAYKKQLIPVIQKAYGQLNEAYDIIVIEGAGSPAEINLKADDIVNMGMAKLADAPVLLVGDIDRGGVFAQLYGTIELLEPEEKARIIGLVVNKFRGDKKLLMPGLTMLEEKCKIPFIGVLPLIQVDLEDEDSLSERLTNHVIKEAIDIAVIQFPKISNFTDFFALDSVPGVKVRYVQKVSDLGEPDMIFLPGSKSTMQDLKWMRRNGLESLVRQKAAAGTLLIGICGGYQMLGAKIEDPGEMEGERQIDGMGLLPVRSTMLKEKVRTRIGGQLNSLSGAFEGLSGKEYEGYEIHIGKTEILPESDIGSLMEGEDIGCYAGNVLGTYVHGIFDRETMREAIVSVLRERKGLQKEDQIYMPMKEYKEIQYNLLADSVRANLDIPYLYECMGL